MSEKEEVAWMMGELELSTAQVFSVRQFVSDMRAADLARIAALEAENTRLRERERLDQDAADGVTVAQVEIKELQDENARLKAAAQTRYGWTGDEDARDLAWKYGPEKES